MSDDQVSAPLLSKELSWLAFNERVLQEAGDKNNPIIQRVRYLGIFSNNLDEFFRVRVADVSRLAAFAKTAEEREQYDALLHEIQDTTVALQAKYDTTYHEVLKALRRRKIYLINDQQLDDKQSEWVKDMFIRQVLPELDPILLDNNTFPEIMDGLLYIAVRIVQVGGTVRHALVEVPTQRLSRFIEIPQRRGRRGRVYIVLENIILHNLAKVFRGVIDIEEVEGYVFKLTRDAELELGEGINQTLIDKMTSSLKKRQRGDPERFVYDRNMPEDLLKLLSRKLNLGKFDSLMPGGRYHNAKDFMSFPNDGPAYLDLQPLPTLPVPELIDTEKSLFDRIKEQDALLYYPYHSFDTIIDLLKTAAVDPSVRDIKICLYRMASKSRIADALISACRNNKSVTAVVELQARFDEAANIDWAKRMIDGGVKVIFGVPGLKVHSKLIVISRQEGNSLKYYSHVGTGNLNEKTAGLYTDFTLLTYNQEIGQDVSNVFEFISYNYIRPKFLHTLVSPYTNRFGIVKQIKNEISNAKAGLPAAITFKCNNLVDTRLIHYLYDASNAGVKIRIICRGMCTLVPGVKGFSENIEAISIVDRYLEHPRVYVFENSGNPLYLISSADLMTRNLDFRVEASVPIYDENLQRRIRDILDIQWSDNVKARVIDAEHTNALRRIPGNAKIRSQEVIHDYLRTGVLPITVKRNRKRWEREIERMAQKRQRELWRGGR